MRVLIFAANGQLGEDYRRVMSDRDPEFFKRSRVVTRPEYLYGTREAEVHCIGHWRDNPNWLLMAELARSRGFKLKEIPDWRPESELQKWL